jgi:hypothetical protein
MKKQIVIGTIFVIFFNGCVQNTVFLGPILTGATTGSVAQAGLSYGSNKVVTTLTGKSTEENIKVLLITKKEEAMLIITSPRIKLLKEWFQILPITQN